MVYELLAMRADARPELLELAGLADRGLELYLAREWEARWTSSRRSASFGPATARPMSWPTAAGLSSIAHPPTTGTASYRMASK